jgi:hypothetical protein
MLIENLAEQFPAFPQTAEDVQLPVREMAQHLRSDRGDYGAKQCDGSQTRQND